MVSFLWNFLTICEKIILNSKKALHMFVYYPLSLINSNPFVASDEGPGVGVARIMFRLFGNSSQFLLFLTFIGG